MVIKPKMETLLGKIVFLVSLTTKNILEPTFIIKVQAEILMENAIPINIRIKKKLYVSRMSYL
jgi:hypothetical protein